jgi:hypothetical protein
MENVTDFVEAVHVELTDERGDIRMLEVLRKDFRELVGGRHDKAVIVVRPGDQMLDASILQHAVELVDECRLDDFRALCGSNSSCACARNRSIALFSASVRLLMLGLGTILGWRPHVGRRGRAHSRVFLARSWGGRIVGEDGHASRPRGRVTWSSEWTPRGLKDSAHGFDLVAPRVVFGADHMYLWKAVKAAGVSIWRVRESLCYSAGRRSDCEDR